MALNIHTIVQDGDAFHAQTRALFIARGTAYWQADPTAGAENAVPGQFGVVGQLAERAADPAGGAPQPGEISQLTVADDFTSGHLRKGRVERRASDLRFAFASMDRVCHVRGS